MNLLIRGQLVLQNRIVTLIGFFALNELALEGTAVRNIGDELLFLVNGVLKFVLVFLFSLCLLDFFDGTLDRFFFGLAVFKDN